MKNIVASIAPTNTTQRESSVTVEFSENKTLGLFGPTEMREIFPAGRPLRGMASRPTRTSEDLRRRCE
jgi:hypothetical protein